MEHEGDGDTNANWSTRNDRQMLSKESWKLKDRAKTIQIIALLKSATIFRRVMETWGDLLSLRLQ